MSSLLNSDFTLGIGIGSFLTIVGAFFTVWIQEKRKRKLVARIFVDLVQGISDFIDSVALHREKSRVIYLDQLDLILSDVNVFGRVRESLCVFDDEQTRRDIRTFFVKAAIHASDAKNRVQNFNRFHYEAQQNNTTEVNQRANYELEEAHRSCEKLEKLMSEKGKIIKKISN